MEKGRSPDPILNCQCRRACGLQLASGIRWRRRHLETTRNPTDRGSRLALSGALAPGETVSRSEGQRRSRFLSARAGAARSCGLTHAEFATAISALVPKASLPVPSSLHSGARFEPGSAAATGDARLRDLASFATPVSELPPGAASAAPVRLPRRLRRQQHRWAAELGSFWSCSRLCSSHGSGRTGRFVVGCPYRHSQWSLLRLVEAKSV